MQPCSRPYRSPGSALPRVRSQDEVVIIERPGCDVVSQFHEQEAEPAGRSADGVAVGHDDVGLAREAGRRRTDVVEGAFELSFEIRDIGTPERRRLLSKNPVDTARIPLLLEPYPDARFVFIHRSPYEVFPSTMNLHRTILGLTALQSVTNDDIESNVLEIYTQVMRQYLIDREQIPAGRLIEVAYADLDQSPQHTVEHRWGFAFDEWDYARRPDLSLDTDVT